MSQQPQEKPDQTVSFNKLQDTLKKANKLRDEQKYSDAKITFDEYFQKTDEYYRQQFSYSCYQMVEKEGQLDKKMFKSIDQLEIKDLVKFKSQYKHLDYHQFIETVAQQKLTLESVIKLAIPSVIHVQIELINLKISFYKTIGLQKEVAQLGEMLIFNTKSSMFPIPSEHYSLFLQKVAKLKKQGQLNNAIKVLKQAIIASQNKQDQQIYYKKLAEFLKQIDKDGNEIMSSFDKAIELSEFSKVQLTRQRSVTLTHLSSFGSVDSHKGLLKYFDQLAKITDKIKLAYVLLQKANVLKDLKDFKQACATFNLAVESVPKNEIGVRCQLLVEQAYFCKDIKRYRQAIICINKADQLNPSSQRAKFLRKMLQIYDLDQSMLNLVKTQIQNTILKYPFGGDTKRYKDQAIQMKKIGKTLEAIQLIKKGLEVSTNSNEQTSVLYRKLAQFLIGVDKDGHEIISCYDKALASSSFDRTSIQRQRKVALKRLSSSGSKETHKGLLKYFDDALKSNSKTKPSEIIIQKANVLKNLGDINQAFTTFSDAVQSLSKDDTIGRYHILLEQAYFCKDIKRYKQALLCVREADQLNPNNQKARFLQSLLKVPNLDQKTLQLVNKQISYTSLYYPFGCDRKQYVARAIKLKKVGNLNQAIQLLKQGIKKSPNDNFKSKIYQKLAHFFKQKDKDGHQVMNSFDQAILLSQNQKDKLISERRQAFLLLCSYGTVNDHQGLAKYFEQRPKNIRPNNLTQSLLQKADFYKRLHDIDRTINSYNQAIKSLKKDHVLWKSQILRQLAFYLCNVQRKQEAILTIQKAQKLSKSKNYDKIRITWLAGKRQQIEQIINRSQDPYELKTIATLIRSEADKYNESIEGQSFLKIIKQKYQNSISVFTKAINLLSDSESIKSFLKDQAYVIMKAYDLKSIDENEVKAFQKQILLQKGILKEFQQIKDIQINSLNSKEYRYIKGEISYQMFKPDSQKTISKNYLSFHKVLDKIVNKMLQKQYLSSMSIKQIVYTDQIKLNLCLIRIILHNLFTKLWESHRYDEAIIIYEKFYFLKPEASFMNENQFFSVAQTVFEVTKLYKAQKWQNSLNLLKIFNPILSIEISAKVSICRNRSLDVILQKMQAVSLWNIGRYEEATKVFSDMVFYSKKQISQFWDIKSNNRQDIDCRNIVKYSSIIQDIKQKKYEKAIVKMKKFENDMNNGKKINDNRFYFIYIQASFTTGKKLKYLGNQKYLDHYCDMIQKLRLAQKISPIINNHDVWQKMKKIINEVRESFFENIKKIQEKIIIFRDLHINNKSKSSTFDSMREQLYTINNYLKTCLKILTFNIIQQNQKIQNLKSLKQCWAATCYIIYKEVVNKGVTQNITFVHNLINELKEQVLEIKNDHGKQIDRDSLQRLPDVLKGIKQNYIDEFESVLGAKTKDSLKQISQAYQKIKNYLQTNQKGDIPLKILQQIAKQYSDVETNNSFFTDMLSDLQDRVTKLLESQGKQKISKESYLELIDKIKNDLVDDIEKRMKKTLDEINQAYETMNNNVKNMLQNNPSSMENSEVIKQLIAGHMNMKDENKFFQDMLDEALNLTDNINQKIDQLEKVIQGLQQTTQNKIGVQQIESMLKNLTQKHVFKEITEQSQLIVKKLLSDIEQNQYKIVELEKRIYDYVEKNISKLLDNISTILQPINDGTMEKFFKRFKDDLFLRDIKIKDLEGKLSKFVETDVHYRLNQKVQDQLKKLNQQNRLSRNNIQKLNYELKLAEEKFTNMANNRDLKQIKQQLKINQEKSQDLKKKLDILQVDTFIKNYNDLMENFDQLKSYIKLNDKKIGILSQKLGTKIVTSFNNILRNDDVTMKGGKLKFKPQKQEILLNINDNNPQTISVHKSNEKMELTMPKIQKNLPSFNSSRTSRKKRAQSYLNTRDLPQFIDKGRRHVDIEGQINRKVNVVIMKDNFTNQEEKTIGRNKIKSRRL